MYEKYLILTRGLGIVTRDGRVIAFQVNIRIPYYRGVRLSLIDTVQLTVDGESFNHGQMTFSTGGSTYTLWQLAKTTEREWSMATPPLLR